MMATLDENLDLPAIEAVMIDDRVNILDGTLEGTGVQNVKANRRKLTGTIEFDIHLSGRQQL
jgi:hypothetical protein